MTRESHPPPEGRPYWTGGAVGTVAEADVDLAPEADVDLAPAAAPAWTTSRSRRWWPTGTVGSELTDYARRAGMRTVLFRDNAQVISEIETVIAAGYPVSSLNGSAILSEHVHGPVA
jgi:hypothetical protein